MNISSRCLSAISWLSLAGAILSGCKPSEKAEAKAPPLPTLAVSLATPKHGPITRSITLPATIRPEQQVTLYAKVAGYLKSIRVDRGDRVKEGELLAEVEVPELIADQAKYEAERRVAKVDYERLGDAQKKAPDLVVPLTIDTARGKLEMAEANLKRNDTLLGYAKIVAPFSGTISKRWVDAGALIPAATSSTSPQNAAVLTLMDASKVRVNVAVPEPETPLIKNGLPVEVTVDELPGKTFQGTITRFANSLDDATQTMTAEADFPNSDGILLPGMFAKARITVEKKADALLVPTDAVLVEKAKTSVFIVADGKAKKLPVKVGFDDGKSVEILEGISGSESVILVGKLPLSDGQAIKPTEAK